MQMYSDMSKDELLKLLKYDSRLIPDTMVFYGGTNQVNPPIKEWLITERKILWRVQKHYRSYSPDGLRLGIWNNKKVGFCTIYGTVEANQLTDIFCKLGTKRFIHYGSCGSINKSYNYGDIFLAQSAEYTSLIAVEDRTGLALNYWLKENMRKCPNISALKLCELPYEDNGLTIRKGRIITIDSITDQDMATIRFFSALGFDAVDMETGIVYRKAQQYNAEALAVLFVSDRVILGETISDRTPEQNAKVHQARDAAFELVKSLII